MMKKMRVFQRYFAVLTIFVIVVVIFEEFYYGKAGIWLSNRYNNVIYERITVTRDKRTNIGIVIVLDKHQNEKNYALALDTVRCYSTYFGYDLHVIYTNEDDELMKVCKHKDFMFRRHCALAHKMGESIKNEWILFLDADMGVINPNHLIEDYIPTNSSKNIVFYNRIMNQEIMAGSYLVKNTPWSIRFLNFWANYEDKLPKSFHGSDNGAIHSVIAEFDMPKYEEERVDCEKKYWENSQNYEDLSTYEVCIQILIRKHKTDKVLILDKGRFAWARDGWLSNSVWSPSDFILHGWQLKRRDVRIFGRWFSPIVHDQPFNQKICNTEKAHLNWKYKDTFMGSIVDVDRQIYDTIHEQTNEFYRIQEKLVVS